MIKQIISIKLKTLKENDAIKIIYAYRYFSLVLTSIFYICSNSNSDLKIKFVVIFSLSIASILLNYLYFGTEPTNKTIILFILIESAGNMLLLIPTGGIESPYLWYSLNTVLISVYLLKYYYCLINLFAYIAGSSFISYMIFNQNDSSIFDILYKNSNLILSLILITVVIQKLLMLVKKLNCERVSLSTLNNQLFEANKVQNESINHILALYQAVQSLTSLKDKSRLMKLIMFYTREITKSSLVFTLIPDNNDTLALEVYENETLREKELLLNEVVKNYTKIKSLTVPYVFKIENRQFMVINLSSSNKQYGILGKEIVKGSSNMTIRQNFDQLKFIAALSAIVFERFEVEDVTQSLLISEEQNRIANEIHDSVSQRLFALSCGINSLRKKIEKNYTTSYSEEFDLIIDSLDKAIKELRETIYGLSRKKSGRSIFKTSVAKYISDISKLHGLEINFNFTGSEEYMPIGLKKAFYRIICEGINNSIRHGKSSNINIDLEVTRGDTALTIKDNGNGFDVKNKLFKKESGLGINNIFNLVYSFNGSINFDSNIGCGTLIDIIIPNNNNLNIKQENVI